MKSSILRTAAIFAVIAAMTPVSNADQSSDPSKKKPKIVELSYGSAVSIYKSDATEGVVITQPTLQTEKIELLPAPSDEREQPGKYEAERSFTEKVSDELEAHITYSMSWYGGKLTPFVYVNSGLRRIKPDADGYQRYVCLSAASGSITKPKTLEIDMLTNCLVGDTYYLVKSHIRQ